MTISKRIPILKPFYHPVTKKYVVNITAEKIKELGIQPNEDLIKYADKLDKLNLSNIIGLLFDSITCQKPSLFLLYSNMINWINESKKNNIDYITLTLEECKNFKSIFENTIITKPENNAYVLFLIEFFNDIIKNFDTLDDVKQKVKE